MTDGPKSISRRAIFEGIARRSSRFVRAVVEDPPPPLSDTLEKALRVLGHHARKLHWGVPEAALGADREAIAAEVRDVLASEPDDATVRRLRELYVALPWFRPVAEVEVLRSGRSLYQISEGVEPPEGPYAARAEEMRERILAEVAHRTAELDP